MARKEQAYDLMGIKGRRFTKFFMRKKEGDEMMEQAEKLKQQGQEIENVKINIRGKDKNFDDIYFLAGADKPNKN